MRIEALYLKSGPCGTSQQRAEIVAVPYHPFNANLEFSGELKI
jgi:hypothetical protein